MNNINNVGWTPYFKVTRRHHDSGFRCFEVGYCKVPYGQRATHKVVVGYVVDHIATAYYGLTPFQVDIDATTNGYCRVFRADRDLFWYVPGFSDAFITDDPQVTLEELERRAEEIK